MLKMLVRADCLSSVETMEIYLLFFCTGETFVSCTYEKCISSYKNS